MHTARLAIFPQTLFPLTALSPHSITASPFVLSCIAICTVNNNDSKPGAIPILVCFFKSQFGPSSAILGLGVLVLGAHADDEGGEGAEAHHDGAQHRDHQLVLVVRLAMFYISILLILYVSCIFFWHPRVRDFAFLKPRVSA